MALEVRYVGTRGVNQWSTLNYNERNIMENGFLDEFKRAMTNLRANNAAGGGRSGSFAYFGPGSGTNPLPIYLAYLNGRADADNPAAYTGGTATWTNATLAGRLVHTNPNPNFVSSATAAPRPIANANAAGDLDNNLTFRNNALAAGLPANFFVVNPHADQVSVRDSGAFSTYHAMQVELRRRLSNGLALNGSYQYALEEGSEFLGFHFGRAVDAGQRQHPARDQGAVGLDAFRSATSSAMAAACPSVLKAIVSDWQFNGAGRFQRRTTNFGNVRLVGMTKQEAQKLYKFDIRNDPQTGPADRVRFPRRCDPEYAAGVQRQHDQPERLQRPRHSRRPLLRAGQQRRLHPAEGGRLRGRQRSCCSRRGSRASTSGLTKKIRIGGSKSIELRGDVLNVFNNTNFTVTDNSRPPGAGASIFQTVEAYRDLDNTYDPGGRLGQLAIRFNW